MWKAEFSYKKKAEKQTKSMPEKKDNFENFQV